MNKFFKASLDGKNRMLSNVLLVVMVIVIAVLANRAMDEFGAGRTAEWMILAAAATGTLLIIVAAALLSPRGYRVSSDQVTVVRPLLPVRIAREEIAAVRPVELRSVIRIFGWGGLFGGWGWFRAAEVGNFRAYVTKMKGFVCIDRHNKRPIVVSPDDVEGFIAAASPLAAGENRSERI